VIKKLKDR